MPVNPAENGPGSPKRSFKDRLASLAPPGARDPDSRHYWQERILLAVLLVGALGTPLTLLGLLSAILEHQAWLLLSLDLSAWAVAMFILLRPRLPYRVRAICTCLSIFIIALALLDQLGPNIPMPAWLFAFAVLSGLLLGRRAALIAVAMNAATLILIGLGLERQVWVVGDLALVTIDTWPESVLSFLFLNLLVSVGVSQVVLGLAISHQRAKQQAVELQTLKDMQKSILDSIAAGIFLVEPETGRIAYANSAALHMLGQPESAVVGHDCRWFLRGPGDTDSPEGDHWRSGCTGEKNLRTALGRELPVMSTATPLAMEGGEYILETFVDVSQRKMLEEQLLSARKLEAIGTLAGGIAHDFNNILGAILGFAEMAHRDSLSGKVDPSNLAQIMASGKRAAELVRQMLAFGRKQPPALKALDLNRVVRTVRSALMRTLPEDIAIQTQLAEDLPLLLADESQVEQVLMNLASNAADVMPEGGRLILETRPVVLDDEYCRRHPEVRPGEYVKLSISDTGQGMDPDTLEHIFEPFYTTKEVGKGTGMGLASAFGTIKNHGGHIHCHSEPGMGTTFNIYLPAHQEKLPGLDNGAQADREAGLTGDESILLVDDEAALRLVGAHILRGRGYNVQTAGSCEEALKRYRQADQRPELVIMDANLPLMDGNKCMEQILSLDPGAKVVIAGGRVKASLETGAAGYVAKPFGRMDLLTTVRAVLDHEIAR